jgi:uncharacterized protein
VEFYPQSEWRYGMNQTQMSNPDKFKVIESPMTDNPFLVETAPVRMQVSLRMLPQWEASWKPVLESPSSDLKFAPRNPTSLPNNSEIQADGSIKTMTLVPYGCTHLRLTTLPIIKTENP